MNDSPLVSVITPCYNAARFIVETIESVRDQDYPNIEHVIMDGGSGDGTQQLLARFSKLKWVSEPDHGQSHALNKGFRQARGEIIGWLNADDTYQPGAVSTAVRFLQENPEVDLVYSDVRVVDENGQLMGVSHSQSFDLLTFIKTNYIRQPTVFMRRHVIDRLKGVDENLHYVMDYEFWLRAVMIGFDLQYLPEQQLANFRMCPGTKSFEQAPCFLLEWMRVLEHVFSDPYFDTIDDVTKLRILKKNRSQYYFSLSIQAIKNRNRHEMLVFFAQSAMEDFKIVLYVGNLFIIGMGLLGRSVDWRRKFEK
jgi:glycosyltransferase involved in cell wall biosynthesis